ncbi:MAG: hypothetical protein Q9181_007433 [Wetmoreana brouardii]
MCGITATLTLSNRHSKTQSLSREPPNLYDGGIEAPTGQISSGATGSLQDDVDHSLESFKHRGPDLHGSWIADDGRVDRLPKREQDRETEKDVPNKDEDKDETKEEEADNEKKANNEEVDDNEEDKEG